MMLSFLFLHGYSKIEISDLNLVMPFKVKGHKSPTYNVTAYAGNVKWVSSNEKLLSVQPNPANKQESSAMISVQYEGPNPEEVQLRAISPNKEEYIVRVSIDRIASARIETNRIDLYANYSVDEYSLRGYDKSGNKIATIDGYDVEWSYNTSEIRRIYTNETDLVPKYGKLESHIMVQGLLVGKSSLGAKIGGSVVAPNVTLTILDPIYLEPDNKRMLPGCNFHATLCKRIQSDAGKCHKISLPKAKYVFTSDDEKIGTVKNDAKIHTVNIGVTKIRVEDQEFTLNRGEMTLEVVAPYGIYIPEQSLLLGDVPSTNDAKFFDYEGNEFEKPDHIDWQLTEEYKTLGDHWVTATAFDKSTKFLVHVYERSRFIPDNVVLPLHHNGYIPNLVYGSGDFTWTTSNTNGIILDMFHHIISYEVGKYQVIVHDDKLNVDAILDVSIETMVDPRFIFPRTEFIPNENISYTFQVRSQSGRPFDYIDNYTVISDHPCIVNDSENILTSTRKGFATIICMITDYEQTTLICVYEPLSVTKIITVDNVEEETPCKLVSLSRVLWHCAPPYTT